MNFQFASTSYSIRLRPPQGREVEPGPVLDEVAELVAQRRGRPVEVEEDEALPGVEADRRQAVVLEREVVEVVGVLGPDERAVEVVDPGVVRALEADDLAARLLGHGRAAVAADVVEGAQHAVAAADDDERVVVELDERCTCPGSATSSSRATMIQSRRTTLARSHVEDGGVVVGALGQQRGAAVLAADRGELVRGQDRRGEGRGGGHAERHLLLRVEERDGRGRAAQRPPSGASISRALPASARPIGTHT